MPVEFAKSNPGVMVALFSLLITILGAIIGLLIKIIWKIIADLKDSLDRFFAEHLECRKRQESEFLKVTVFDDWKLGRTGPGGLKDEIGELWKALNSHSHSEKGKVER